MIKLVKKRFPQAAGAPALEYRNLCRLLEKDFKDRIEAARFAILATLPRDAANRPMPLLKYSSGDELNARVVPADKACESGKQSSSARLGTGITGSSVTLTACDDGNFSDNGIEIPARNVFILPPGADRDPVRLILNPALLEEIFRIRSSALDYVISLQNDSRAETRNADPANSIDPDSWVAEGNKTLSGDFDEWRPRHLEKILPNPGCS